MSGPSGGFIGVLEVVIAPKIADDRAKLVSALAQFSAADANIGYAVDDRTGEIKLVGIDELQLEEKLGALKSIHRIELTVGTPEVAFRETVARNTQVDYTHKKQTGGTGQYARVKFVVEPNITGAGNLFESRIEGEALRPDDIAGAEVGVWSAFKAGIIQGFPVVDVRVVLVNGAYHEIDSSRLTFEIAARTAVRHALENNSLLLEPIMAIVVSTPEDDARRVVDDLELRRGQVQEQENHDGVSIVAATVPLMNIFGYANSLREITKGRGSYTTRFDRYAPVPSPDDPPFRPAVGMRI